MTPTPQQVWAATTVIADAANAGALPDFAYGMVGAIRMHLRATMGQQEDGFHAFMELAYPWVANAPHSRDYQNMHAAWVAGQKQARDTAPVDVAGVPV